MDTGIFQGARPLRLGLGMLSVVGGHTLISDNNMASLLYLTWKATFSLWLPVFLLLLNDDFRKCLHK